MSDPRPTPTSFLDPALSLVKKENLNSEYATFGQRALSNIIDSLILLFFFCISCVISFVFMPFILLAILIAFLYEPLLQCSPLQGTLGHYWMNIHVCNLDGAPLSFGKACLRSFVKFFLYSATSGISWLFPLWTEKKQTLHDMLCETIVLKRSPY